MKMILASLFGFLLLMPLSVQAQALTDEQKAEIKQLFEEHLMQNGEKILESVNKYQAELQEKERAESEAKAKEFMATLNQKSDYPVAGNPNGDITVVEFFDYNCGYCRRALEELQKVMEQDKNIKVVFMDMPILGPSSKEAAKWSLAAHKQGKYFAYHQAIMTHDGQKDEKVFENLAKNAGLDIKKLKKDIKDEGINAMLDENLAQANALGIRGTPGFIIGGEIFPGFVQAEQMLEIIQAKRNDSKEQKAK